jgi:hypothetical protein
MNDGVSRTDDKLQHSAQRLRITVSAGLMKGVGDGVAVAARRIPLKREFTVVQICSVSFSLRCLMFAYMISVSVRVERIIACGLGVELGPLFLNMMQQMKTVWLRANEQREWFALDMNFLCAWARVGVAW